MISFVIPVYNERESLATLLDELAGMTASENLGPVEFLFIDDGSRDGSWRVIQDLAARDPRVRAIRFRRNFGKAAALTAGFSRAKGEIIFTLDADLQDDPAEVPRFLEMLEQGEGLDVISGWKRTRHDPWHKVFPSRVFNWMVSRLTGTHLHDHNCGFKCYRSEVLREVFIYGELHRFVPVLASSRGFRVGEIEVNHRSRKFGQSKYGFSRFFKGFLDLMTVRFLTGYGQRPQHVLGVLGLILLAVGVLGMGYLAVYWIIDHWVLGQDHPIGSRPLLTYSTALLVVGTQLVSLGVLAELVTSYNLRAEDTYSVAETIDSGSGFRSESEAEPSFTNDSPSPSSA
ncbi:glycosyltransferase family 2 protein [Tautonia rosea]|uniref:glycosyltransferase family 2 protein n=1 Tax=Tautonia rosea TaxID=2728037 RepID=UPI001476511A|nr:glycosyltransferase family 2 protein [Tautonia rosea]